MSETVKKKDEFNWFSRVVTIAPYSVGGGPCDKCEKVEGIKVMTPKSGYRFIPQRRHRVHFDVRGKTITKDICTPCKNFLATLVPLPVK